jgi:hypothetical protein
MSANPDPTPSWFEGWSQEMKDKMEEMAQQNTIQMEEMKDQVTAVMNGRFDRLERLILPASSAFFKDFPVLRPDVSKGIQGARAPTWTMMRLGLDTDADSRILAVSSAHVGLQYGTVRETSPDKNKRLFVQLPEAICAAGIKKVHLHKTLLDCEKGRGFEAMDICVVELERLPKDITRTIPYPSVGSGKPSENPSWLLQQLFGCSSMESVTGSCLACGIDVKNPYLLCVLSHGEQGDSGTLLFTIGSGNADKNELVGLFQGVSTSRGGGPNMRKRGKITPIPAFEELKELCPYPRHAYSGEWGSIALVTAGRTRTYTISPRWNTPGQDTADVVTLKPVDKYAGNQLIGVIVKTEQELGVKYKTWGFGAISPGDWEADGGGDGHGDVVDSNYGPTISMRGDGDDDDDEICSTGDTSLKQKTYRRGIKRNGDAVGFN